ncbi:MAG: acetyl-CoA decarbonylase/synthase complex subunit gamma [Candidatus Gastranaerophilales bacterium]|nr:acetyl-CoA decarbonylase/synthase complex subunit gamma [Candidatus Gastranaerophilales bacterium]
MALTGLQIFKHLPGGKKEKEANCKKCGFPTCMAFAMKLAKQETTSDNCEYISDELKALLEEASIKQQREIKFGKTDRQVIVGNETVMFRHDKTFVNPTCLAVKLESSDSDFEIKLASIANYSVERVGENLKIDAIALIDADNSFTDKAIKVANTGLALILQSSNFDTIKEVLASIKEYKPLVCLKNIDISKIIEIEKEYGVPVVVSGSNIEDIVNKSTKAIEAKSENLVLNLEKSENIFEDLTYIRRSAIENKFRPLGFPTITFIDQVTEDTLNSTEKTVNASVLMCKYSNILVLDTFDEALIYTLLTLRQNIFTDPQKPLQIEPKVYPIGDVDRNSPILVSTNFALTYFVVASEAEASGVPVYLIITPSDGMSVLTAWAASKFTGETIAKAVKEAKFDELVDHREIIIPGYVGNLKEEIEEELPGWEIIIGPNEVVELPDFIRNYKNCLKL